MYKDLHLQDILGEFSIHNNIEERVVTGFHQYKKTSSLPLPSMLGILRDKEAYYYLLFPNVDDLSHIRYRVEHSLTSLVSVSGFWLVNQDHQTHGIWVDSLKFMSAPLPENSDISLKEWLPLPCFDWRKHDRS